MITTAPEPYRMPSLGQTVWYRLDALDVGVIEAHRRQSLAATLAAAVPAPVDSGTDVAEGDLYAAVVVRVCGIDAEAGVSLRVLLDGTDTLWAERRTEGARNGTWCWPDS
jgi:hypothetical protein